jgi:RimJ/RimL family protein N-acetyltransferase
MLETTRLQLRPLRADDREAWNDFITDPEATRLLHVPQPVPTALATRLLDRWLEHFADPVGMYAAVERESGETAGFVGFVPRELEWGEEIELGWLLRRPFHGRGYATEAAKALRPLVPGRVISLVRVENEASSNVAHKLGMEVEREIEFASFPTYVFVSPRPLP